MSEADFCERILGMFAGCLAQAVGAREAQRLMLGFAQRDAYWEVLARAIPGVHTVCALAMVDKRDIKS